MEENASWSLSSYRKKKNRNNNNKYNRNISSVFMIQMFLKFPQKVQKDNLKLGYKRQIAFLQKNIENISLPIRIVDTRTFQCISTRHAFSAYIQEFKQSAIEKFHISIKINFGYVLHNVNSYSFLFACDQKYIFVHQKNEL